MLKRGSAVLGSLLILVLLASPVAAFQDFGSGDETEVEVDPSIGSEGASVTVRSVGQTVEAREFRSERKVGIPPACWYGRWLTGKQYYELWTGKGWTQARAQMPAHYRSIPLPNFEEHKDSTDGYWYLTDCRDDATLDQINAFDAANPPVYWTPQDPEPRVRYEVDVHDLVEAAHDFTDLPKGTIEWNPKVGGVGATVVGLDTWVWLEGAATEVSVHAEVDAGSTWAQVDAVLDRMELSAPGADPVTCAGAGTKASEASSARCALVFHRSSAKRGGGAGSDLSTVTLTARAVWTASWTSSLGGPAQDLETQEVVVTTEIPVAEVQSLTTLR